MKVALAKLSFDLKQSVFYTFTFVPIVQNNCQNGKNFGSKIFLCEKSLRVCKNCSNNQITILKLSEDSTNIFYLPVRYLTLL